MVNIVVKVYVQQKTCIKCLVVVWLRLLFKVLFTWKCIKIMYFYFLKIIFDISTSKWSKNTKNSNSVLQNSVKKACKNRFMKTAFQTQFFSEPYSIKHSFFSYQTLCYVFCTANIKANAKQTYPYLRGFISILKVCYQLNFPYFERLNVILKTLTNSQSNKNKCRFYKYIIKVELIKRRLGLKKNIQ